MPKLGKFSTSLPSSYRCCYSAITQIHFRTWSQTETETALACPVFLAERIVPPLRIARRGEVIFLGSRNNFPNPPFRSSAHELNSSMYIYRKFVTRAPRTCCSRCVVDREVLPKLAYALQCRCNFLILKRPPDTIVWYLYKCL